MSAIWLQHVSAGAQNCFGEVPLGYNLSSFLSFPQGIPPIALQVKEPIFTHGGAQPLSCAEDWCGRRGSPGSASHHPLHAPALRESKKMIKCPCVAPKHISSLVNISVPQFLLHFSWCTCTTDTYLYPPVMSQNMKHLPSCFWCKRTLSCNATFILLQACWTK